MKQTRPTYVFIQRQIYCLFSIFLQKCTNKTVNLQKIFCIRFSGCLCHKPAAVALEAAAISDV